MCRVGERNATELVLLALSYLDNVVLMVEHSKMALGNWYGWWFIHILNYLVQQNWYRLIQEFTIRLTFKFQIRTNGTRRMRHKCELCGKVFMWKKNFTRHYRSHLGEFPYHCSICNKGTSNRQNMAMHMIRVHKTDPELKCNYCTEVLHSWSALKIHMWNRHHIRWQADPNCAVANDGSGCQAWMGAYRGTRDNTKTVRPTPSPASLSLLAYVYGCVCVIACGTFFVW